MLIKRQKFLNIKFSFQINNDPNLLSDVTLALRWNDTFGDTVVATRAITEMICDGIAAFFGPEGPCYVEAIVSQSRNIPMISYVSSFVNSNEFGKSVSFISIFLFLKKCSDYKASSIPTFARTEPPDTQVIQFKIMIWAQNFTKIFRLPNLLFRY